MARRHVDSSTTHSTARSFLLGKAAKTYVASYPSLANGRRVEVFSGRVWPKGWWQNLPLIPSNTELFVQVQILFYVHVDLQIFWR